MRKGAENDWAHMAWFYAGVESQGIPRLRLPHWRRRFSCNSWKQRCPCPHAPQRRTADFLVISLWDSFECIGEFAGQNIEMARYYPEDTKFLLGLEPNVHHYEVASFGKLAELPQVLGSGGRNA